MIKYENESQFREEFTNRLEESGWETWEEVWSDGRNGRVDVIADHPELATLGFELKLMDGKTGNAAAEALKQLFRYQRQDFEGKDIDLWVLAVRTSRSVTEREKKFMRSMFNDLGFGFLDCWGLRMTVYFGMLNRQLCLQDPSRSDSVKRIKRRARKKSLADE